MNRSIATAMVLGLLVGAACKKSDDTKSAPMTTEKTSASKEPAPAPSTASADATASVGVKAGGIQHAESEGPAAVLSTVQGTVEVRRVGETQYTAAKADTKLYPGDSIRTAESSTAKVTLADSSVVEL